MQEPANEQNASNTNKPSGLSDDAWDGIAAVMLITITVTGLVYWLTNM
jgi:hypothetical protein